ncbi:hypothetical protein QJS10_CPA06g01048 [Acorus calamus]|uniref:Uncharacterized protein n=1 Tax=Acorus calamus TaxID=4465 RepID=A0AAV9ESU4_ACOCL|nr:hypothetical protein QJS10_CPA06g01048 [Acorus calamus]
MASITQSGEASITQPIGAQTGEAATANSTPNEGASQPSQEASQISEKKTTRKRTSKWKPKGEVQLLQPAILYDSGGSHYPSVKTLEGLIVDAIHGGGELTNYKYDKDKEGLITWDKGWVAKIGTTQMARPENILSHP